MLSYAITVCGSAGVGEFGDTDSLNYFACIVNRKKKQSSGEGNAIAMNAAESRDNDNNEHKYIYAQLSDTGDASSPGNGHDNDDNDAVYDTIDDNDIHNYARLSSTTGTQLNSTTDAVEV